MRYGNKRCGSLEQYITHPMVQLVGCIIDVDFSEHDPRPMHIRKVSMRRFRWRDSDKSTITRLSACTKYQVRIMIPLLLLKRVGKLEVNGVIGMSG